MKILIVVLLGMVIIVSGIMIGCDELVGSGNLETKEYTFNDFTKVEIGSAFKFDISQSDSYGISITADDNVMEDVRVTKSGDTLKIDVRTTGPLRSVTLEATVTMPKLHDLEVSGASRGTISGFESNEDFNIDVSGASKVSGDITAGNTYFDVSGASTLELEGTAGDMEADVSGASHFYLEDFSVNDADVNMSGASSGTVNVNEILDVDLSGASNLKYVGTPRMGDINTSGASSLSKK
ncbi:MAG: head GIN domain-containing protein [Candidatus Thorarchaeota archaeon]